MNPRGASVAAVVDVSSIVLAENYGRLESSRLAPKKMVESIREVGLLQSVLIDPCTLCPHPLVGRGEFLCVDGANRTLALRELGERKVRAVVRAFASEKARAMAAMLANTHRREITLYEETMLVYRLVTKYGEDPVEVARSTGKSSGEVRSMIRAPEILSSEQLESFRKTTNPSVARYYLLAARKRSVDERKKILREIAASPTFATGKRVVKLRTVRTVEHVRDQFLIEESEMIAFRGQRLSLRERAMVDETLAWVLSLGKIPFTGPKMIVWEPPKRKENDDDGKQRDDGTERNHGRAAAAADGSAGDARADAG